MKSKILKISITIILIMALTMTNFMYLGLGLISYAADNSIETNHKNVEFDVYFKNSEGEKVDTLERTSDITDISLYLSIGVQREGYFNGEIELSNSNFNIESSESKYVSRISNNNVTLNQINAGETAEIELKIKPDEEEVIDKNKINCESILKLTGIYRDSTERDIEIEAERTVNLTLIENNNNDSLENSINIITNKIVKISGEDKRVVQLSIDMGLIDDNYPIKEIYTRVNVPAIDGKYPEVLKDINRNTMLAFEYKHENGYVEITLKNESEENDYILWRKQGSENVILTYIYDAAVNLEGTEITSEERLTLYNDKELTSTKQISLSNEEVDSTISVEATNSEQSIYKGKLYSQIDRQYDSKTTLKVNLSNIEEYISISEESAKYISGEEKIDANVYYNKTTISKEQFDTVFGEEGSIVIYNENRELLEEITSQTQANEEGNIVIDYTEKEPKSIEIRTSKPIAEGSIEFNHTKTIKASDKDVVKSASKIATNIVYEYNNESSDEYTKGIELETSSEIELKETTTEVEFETDRDSLSTIIANDIEMKFILKTNDESKDLYRNPTFRIELPEQVESIQINSIDLLYEEELKVANYSVDGRYITIQLEGEQTGYKAQTVEGANLIINATINVNKTSIAKPEEIRVEYTNENVNTYAEGQEVGTISKSLEIVAPKDVTAINSIQDLGIETIGEEESTQVSLQRGAESRELEVSIQIINNNEEAIRDIYILGTFPTRNNENNIDVSVIEGINIENATVYYTENENATIDITNEENGWTEEIPNPQTVKKYLIVMDSMDPRTIVRGTYRIEIPENLEYNQTAKEGYEVTYVKGQAEATSTIKATTITMETGIGPKLEVGLNATVSGQELTENSTVKNGEVIKYRVQVSNTGSEDVSNIQVAGNIPEGTTLVEPVEDYEYTSSSYYQKVEASIYQETIENLGVGQVVYVEYEVMVNSDTSNGTEMTNKAEINFSDVNQKTNELKVLSEDGDLSVVVKRVTDRSIDLYESGVVSYYAIIENISSETKNDVTLKANMSEGLEVDRLVLMTGINEENFEETDIDYADEVNIGTLEPGEVKILEYNMIINDLTENTTGKIQFSTTASDGEKEYRSNLWEDTVNSFDINMTIESNTESQYVKSGDSINYTIRVRNDSNSNARGITIRDEIPSQLTIRRILVNEEEIELETYNNVVEILTDVPENGETTITIETVIDYSEARTEAETITNRAVVLQYGDEIATTSEISHIIEADVENDDNGSGTGNNNNNNQDEENPGEAGNVANGQYMISGLAWFDENGNGRKDDNETTLPNITVRLLNVETNQLVTSSSGDTLEVRTDENGRYVIDNINNGQYIVIFDYDDGQYSLTTYKAEGISDAENSDVRISELLIGNQRQQVAATDIINLQNQNISDISIGLVELQNFDLKLDKYVSRILVQNSAGTTIREYNNTTSAKLELDAKQIEGTNVIIEYNITVTNVGEAAGYVRRIADYKPTDLQFSSELNKDWYETDGTLYTTILGNEIINPGESKTVQLTLTKTMTEENLGLIQNRAEISIDYNDWGLEDINSTPGNNENGENDIGAAEVIISIRTGAGVYISIGAIIAIIIASGVIAGIIVKTKNKKIED